MSEQEYSVSVRNGAGWRRHQNLRFLISVGQPYHNGSKFSAIVDWVNKTPSIKSVQIVVGDLLQGWNAAADGVGGGKAFSDAERHGDLWLKEHNSLICSFKDAAVSVTRWRQWLAHPEYKKTRDVLETLVDQTENGLQSLIRGTGEGILERRQKRGIVVPDREKFLFLSDVYIKEELTVLALMHKHQDQKTADVYPGSILPCMSWFRNPAHALPAELESLRTRYFCRIDFNRVVPETHKKPNVLQVS